jgi:hypothetical protein
MMASDMPDIQEAFISATKAPLLLLLLLLFPENKK